VNYQYFCKKSSILSSIFIFALMFCGCTFEHTATSAKQAPIAASASPSVLPTPSGIPSAIFSMIDRAGLEKTAQLQDCPANKPIKGKIGWTGRTYYAPDSQKYSKVKPHECFATISEALSAGYKAPKPKKKQDVSAPVVSTES
jgi:hypothetical protein